MSVGEIPATTDATFHMPTSNQSGKIVVIDDDAMTLRVLQSQLSDVPYKLELFQSPAQGLEHIDEDTLVAIVDLRMQEMDGFQCLQHITRNQPEVQVIILTGSHDTADAVEAMRAGAFQYITKPCEAKQLRVVVAKAVEAWQSASLSRDLRESNCQNIPVSNGDCFVQNNLQSQIERVAAVESTVCIGGESGTGKSTVARLIHQKSSRSSGPFVSVNCASLPRDLLTSELFGHTKGSFTGADRDRAGHAEVADGGTLFLDEIGDLPLELQPKLLTFLQDRTIQRLGATEPRKVDVRLIVATHRDLAAMCKEHSFREDLYFRLMVLSIDLPPLRDRKDELPGMATAILQRICERMGIPSKQISESAMNLLLHHVWPGNIRELENCLERAAAFATSHLLMPHDLIINHLALDRREERGATTPTPMPAYDPVYQIPRPAPAAPDWDPHRTPDSENSVVWPTGQGPGQSPLLPYSAAPNTGSGFLDPSHLPEREPQLSGLSLKEIEKIAIMQTLQATKGNKAKSARMLGISEKSIYNKMRRHGIDWHNLEN